MTVFLLYLGGVVSGMFLTCIIVSGGRKQPPVRSRRRITVDPLTWDVAHAADTADAIERLIRETRGQVRP
jgi:hypothetical protein